MNLKKRHYQWLLYMVHPHGYNMTELQFLIDLLLNHKLPKDTKALIATRIKDVEDGYNKGNRPIIHQQAPVNTLALGKIFNGAIQSASTTALLEKEGGSLNNNSPIVAAVLPPIPPSAHALNRVIGGEVNTGNGLKGPRKF